MSAGAFGNHQSGNRGAVTQAFQIFSVSRFCSETRMCGYRLADLPGHPPTGVHLVIPAGKMLGGDLSLGSSKKASGRETELGALDSDAHHQSLGETRTLRNYDLFFFWNLFPHHATLPVRSHAISHPPSVRVALPYSRRATVTTHDDFQE